MIKVYKKDDDYVCELWGSSTKHPDSVFKLSKDIENGLFTLCPYADEIEYNLYQWLLNIASRLEFKVSAREVADYALNFYRVNE